MSVYMDLLEEIYLIRMSGSSKIDKAYYYGLLRGRAGKGFVKGNLDIDEYDHVCHEIEKSVESLKQILLL